MDAKILQLFEIFFDRLQRYLYRVVYMFKQISYLGPELRAFTGQEKLTFLRKFIEIARIEMYH